MSGTPLFAFAGLWEPGSFSILTVEACPLVAKIHDRMPAILTPDAEAEWARLVHDELRQSQVASADLVTDTLQAETVTADQLGAWLQSINALRLVLGTRIGVEEDREAFDPDAPDAPAAEAPDPTPTADEAPAPAAAESATAP